MKMKNSQTYVAFSVSSLLMATAFVSWSVNDVKRWINSWNIQYSVSQSTITNLQKAAELNHIDGQTMIYFNKDDLKQIGLKQKDIDIAIKCIDDLVVGAYLDYMMSQQYHFIPPRRQHKPGSSSTRTQQPTSSTEDPYILITVKKILKQGWIQKRGEWNTEWKRRYFVLNNHKEIKYYQDAEKKTHSGNIHLNEVKNIKMGQVVNNKYMFELITDKRVWHLCTDNLIDRVRMDMCDI